MVGMRCRTLLPCRNLALFLFRDIVTFAAAEAFKKRVEGENIIKLDLRCAHLAVKKGDNLVDIRIFEEFKG